jgi:hypothetical protein
LWARLFELWRGGAIDALLADSLAGFGPIELPPDQRRRAEGDDHDGRDDEALASPLRRRGFPGIEWHGAAGPLILCRDPEANGLGSRGATARDLGERLSLEVLRVPLRRVRLLLGIVWRRRLGIQGGDDAPG